MPTRPDPPDHCEEAREYASGDKVYYFRSGTYCCVSTGLSEQPWSGHFWSHLGKWRHGEIKGKGGSSDESPRYLVSRPPLCIDGEEPARLMAMWFGHRSLTTQSKISDLLQIATFGRKFKQWLWLLRIPLPRWVLYIDSYRDLDWTGRGSDWAVPSCDCHSSYKCCWLMFIALTVADCA